MGLFKITIKSKDGVKTVYDKQKKVLTNYKNGTPVSGMRGDIAKRKIKKLRNQTHTHFKG